MSTGWIITLIIIGVSVAILIVLYFFGKKAQKKQAEQQMLMEQNKQTVSMLIIDKKRMKIKDHLRFAIKFFRSSGEEAVRKIT